MKTNLNKQNIVALFKLTNLSIPLFNVADINECGSMPCMNGQCIDGVNGYECRCNAGYTGVMCETSKLIKMIHLCYHYSGA